MGKSLLPMVLTIMPQALAERLSLSSSLTNVFSSTNSSAEGYWSCAGLSCAFFLLIETLPVLFALLRAPAARQPVARGLYPLPDGPYGYSWQSRAGSRQSEHRRGPETRVRGPCS